MVIIGILIALYINNANIKRQTKNKVVSLFEAALVELEQNLIRSNRVIDIYRFRDSIYYLTMEDKITSADYAMGKIPNDWNVALNSFDFDHNVISQLLDKENDIPIKYREVFDRIKNLHNTRKTDVNLLEMELLKVVRANNKDRKKYSWFSLYREEDKQANIEYLLNSHEHKMIAHEYKINAVDGLVRFGLFYQRAAIQIYYELGKLLEASNLNLEFMPVKDYDWMIGKWVSSEDLVCNITNDPGRFNEIGKKYYSSLHFLDIDNKWQRQVFILDKDKFAVLNRRNRVMNFIRMNKASDNLFHMISNKGDTITYKRVLD